MSGGLSLSAALLLGLIASGHCLLMCGGISAALMLSAEKNPRGRPKLSLLLAMQFGRVTSYMLAAMALSGIGASLVQFVDQEKVRLALRIFSALVFASIGFSLLGRTRSLDAGISRALWPRLAPLARKLLPVRCWPQAFALGAIWGWMPCSFVYSVLLIATLSIDPLHSAAIMLLFGLGTMPMLLASAYGAAGGLRLLAHARARSATGVVLLVLASLTVAGPWLVAHTGLHSAHWLPLECIYP